MGKDVTYGLKIKTDQFEQGLDDSHKKLQEFGKTRLDGLKQQLQGLGTGRLDIGAQGAQQDLGSVRRAARETGQELGVLGRSRLAMAGAVAAGGIAIRRSMAGVQAAATGGGMRGVSTRLGRIGMAAGAASGISGLAASYYARRSGYSGTGPPPIPGSQQHRDYLRSQSLRRFSGAAGNVGYGAAAGAGITGLLASLRGAQGPAAQLQAQMAMMGRQNFSGPRQGLTSMGSISGAIARGPMVALKAALGAAAAAAGLLYVGWRQVSASFRDNAAFEMAREKMTAFTGSAGLAKSMLNSLRDNALQTGFDPKQIVEAGGNLVIAAKGSKAELMKLIDTAKILSRVNPAEGLKGASFSLKEALADDYVSIIERFNISRSIINKLKSEGMSGLALVQEAMSRSGITNALIERTNQTWEARKSQIMGFFGEFRRVLGEGVFAAASAKLGGITEWIRANSTYIMDVARGLGVVLQEKLAAAQVKAQGVLVEVMSFAVTVKAYGTALLAWIQEIPARFLAAWDSGALTAFITNVWSLLAQQALAFAKFLGTLIWGGIESGWPMIKAFIGKGLIDMLSEALGPRLTKMFGLKEGAERLNAEGKEHGRNFVDVATEATMMLGEQSAANLKQFAPKAQKFGGEFGLTGALQQGSEAAERARQTMQAPGAGVREFFSGSIEKAAAAGAKIRGVQEAEDAKADAEAAAKKGKAPTGPKPLTEDEQKKLSAASGKTFRRSSIRANNNGGRMVVAIEQRDSFHAAQAMQ